MPQDFWCHSRGGFQIIVSRISEGLDIKDRWQEPTRTQIKKLVPVPTLSQYIYIV